MAGGAFFSTKPPLLPTGTMTVFFTICALTRPSTSVRKSSGRSDQRSPPRATLPPRRCTPSKRVEYTKISNIGRGSGSPGTFDGSNLKDRNGRRGPSSPLAPTPVRQKFVRDVARISARYCLSTRSSLRLLTFSSACSIAFTWLVAAAASAAFGSNRSLNSCTSNRAIRGCVRERGPR